jgi:hypothetical protein
MNYVACKALQDHRYPRSCYLRASKLIVQILESFWEYVDRRHQRGDCRSSLLSGAHVDQHLLEPVLLLRHNLIVFISHRLRLQPKYY